MGDGWLWVVSQRTGEEGQVYEDIVEDLVIISVLIFRSLEKSVYSKTRLKRPLKNRQSKVLMTNGS